VKGKHDAYVADALLATVSRHLAKADPATREAVLAAVRDLALEPSGETVRAFAERISAAPLNGGARRSVIGAVMNALPRSAPVPTGLPSSGVGSSGEAQAPGKRAPATSRNNKGLDRNNTAAAHNSSAARARRPRSRR
jgi:hypothetical protein